MQITAIASVLSLLAGYAVALPAGDPSTADLAFEVPSLSPPVNMTTKLHPIEPRGIVWRDIKICANSKLSGSCLTQRIKANQECYGLPPYMNDKSSSLWVAQAFCTVYKDQRCTGPSRQIQEPGIDDFKTIGFNDMVSSFKCQYYTALW
ncbi:uncharacterized protein BKCO1_4400030 [Diplodia corticola]|uniref:Beta gamma crystallin n=1 Tax=Diplodia corticola TaxID=236234 RepID=A0A1J9QTQ4_9PEZI|nr:uncharacterized protein BKCO1_4400030 [Diplodia corticola]OJD31777.1 hypothetical protein BKCO1_4400030 [Diplodia corticola]